MIHKRTQNTIDQRIKLMRRVQNDLDSGKYPGRNYDDFKKYYKGSTQYWQALGKLNMIDYKKPCANVNLTDVRNIRKASLLAAEMSKKSNEKRNPQQKINFTTETKPAKRKYTSKQTTPKPVTEIKGFELTLFWGLVKIKK